MPSYTTKHTDYGLARIAAAAALPGSTINLTHMAVGDGGGAEPTPLASQTSLVNERYRTAINLLTVDPADPSNYIVEMLIPAAIGGWSIREFGVFDDAGQLFAVGNFPTTYKTIPSDGATSDLVVRCEVQIANAGVINLIVDPAVAVATQQWVVTNITKAALIPGGLTGQVLRKVSNADGDTEWADPSSATNILVDVVEEPVQTIASGQITVTLTTCNTTGLAVYIEGVRIPRAVGVDGWQAGSSTQVVLGKQYPPGSRFTAFQNDPAANIPDPLTASQNLADVPNKATARANLQVYSKTESDQFQPAGNVAFTARTTPPSGWLAANGAAVSRTVYAALFAAIGTTYGAGDGSTTFNVPDLRGEFIRGLDSGRGVDTGRAAGSWQQDSIRNHAHGVPNVEETGANVSYGLAGGSALGSVLLTASSGDIETRPRNVALLAIIKF